MKYLTKKKIIVNIISFIGLIGITFFIIFKECDVRDISNSLKSVNLVYVFIGIICMFLFILCEGLNIKSMLKIFFYDIGVINGLKYAFIGFFFSSITPLAFGGQPMQVYYMNKDNIKISHSSIVLLIELATFQFASIVIAIVAFIGNYKFFMELSLVIKILILFGIIFNVIMAACIVLLVFSKKIINKLIEIVFYLMSKIKSIDCDKYEMLIDNEISQYKEGARFVKKNKYIMAKILIVEFIKTSFIYSITFCVYKAFNLSQFSFTTIFSIQAVLSIAVSIIPLPGAVGSGESAFFTLFKTLFPATTLSSAMLLSRGISFYLFVIISGIVVVCAGVLKSNIKSSYTIKKVM